MAANFQPGLEVATNSRNYVRAGEGNRTLTTSLEGWSSTIELHPRETFRKFRTTTQTASTHHEKPKHQKQLILTIIGQSPPETPRTSPAKWREQDSNLRRLSHQIYSLAPLAARVSLRCIILKQAANARKGALLPTSIHFKKHTGTPGALRRQQRHSDGIPHQQLATGVEPTTAGLQNRCSAN